MVGSVVISGAVSPATDLRATSAPELEIRLLGEPEVVAQGRTLELPASKKTRALLGYLATTGRPHRRERLCELLWDGPDDPRAGLRWSLAKLRPLLSAGGHLRIAADRERVGFESQGAEVDVVAIRAQTARGVASLHVDELRRMAARFRGPFLEGLELASCPVFHAWCTAEREALRMLHVSTLTALVQQLAGTPAQALEHARALVALDPLAESARMAVIDLLAALGEPRRALDEYQEYKELLARELGVKPSPELERRRTTLSVPHAQRAPGAAAAAFVTERAESEARTEGASVPFVGRRRERELLARALDDATRGGVVLFVLGEPGLGKSRLLEELGRLARERGGRVLAGRAFEAELVRPYGAFIEALRAGGESRFLETETTATSSPFVTPQADRTQLYDAVGKLLVEAARAQPPLVLLLDDLHWFDEASAELFHYLARGLRSCPVLLAASARSGELADNPAAQRLVRVLGREHLALSMELAPLSPREMSELVSALSTGEDARRVLAEAAGSPLFALEAARALAAGTRDLVGSLSQLMAERLGRLHEAERALLSWAAALGRSFDVDVLARVTGISLSDLLLSLERLERHAILRERGSSYDFAHDLLRQSAYRQMSEPRRRLVHAQIARALSALADPEGALAGDVAHHAGLAGDAQLATRACLAAGRRCLRLFATREAIDLALRGLHHASALPAIDRVPLAVELMSLQVHADPNRRHEAALSNLAVEARELGLGSLEARAFFLRSLIEFHVGDQRGAFESSLSRIEATRHATPEELGQELAGTARCFLMLQRDLAAAEKFLGQASDILGERNEPLDVVWSRGLLAEAKGELDAAASWLERALLLAHRQDGHFETCECLLMLALVELDRSEPGRARERAAELSEVARKLGEGGHGPAADCISALALAQSSHETEDGGARAREAFERTLPALREAGASRMLALVLVRAARLELLANRAEPAEHYAREALSAALRVERSSEIVEARCLLADIALARERPSAARDELEALEPYAESPDLSARSVKAFERLRSLLLHRGER